MSEELNCTVFGCGQPGEYDVEGRPRCSRHKHLGEPVGVEEGGKPRECWVEFDMDGHPRAAFKLKGTAEEYRDLGSTIHHMVESPAPGPRPMAWTRERDIIRAFLDRVAKRANAVRAARNPPRITFGRDVWDVIEAELAEISPDPPEIPSPGKPSKPYPDRDHAFTPWQGDPAVCGLCAKKHGSGAGEPSKGEP